MTIAANVDGRNVALCQRNSFDQCVVCVCQIHHSLTCQLGEIFIRDDTLTDLGICVRDVCSKIQHVVFSDAYFCKQRIFVEHFHFDGMVSPKVRLLRPKQMKLNAYELHLDKPFYTGKGQPTFMR